MHGTQSPWSAAPGHKPWSALTRDVETQVVVVGGGIAGMATAYALTRAGKEVMLLEAKELASGVTGRSTAKPMRVHALRPLQMSTEHALDYLHANQAAIGAMQQWIYEHQIDCDWRTAEQWIYAREPETAVRLHELRSLLEQASIIAHVHDDVGEALGIQMASYLRVENEQLFDPVAFVRGLALAADDLGCFVHEQTRVVEMERHQDHRLVITADGYQVRAQDIVVATHVPIFDRTIVFAEQDYYRATCLAFEVPDVYARYPVAGTPADGGLSFRPTSDHLGRELLVVSGLGRALDSDLAESEARRQLEDQARETFKDLGELRYAWMAHDAFSADHRPFAGSSMTDKHVLLCTGFGAWGLAGGVAAALTLTGLIMRGHAQWEEFYSPRRFKPMVHPTTFKAGLKSVKHMRGAERPQDGQATVVLRRGESTVVKIGSDDIAAYRDVDGQLHAVSARCTHKGCLVHFNDADQTWDCPCHGSRFAVDGTVLEGPAHEPLVQAEVADEDQPTIVPAAVPRMQPQFMRRRT